MLLRYDPFPDVDRLAEQAFGRGTRPVLPMDAVRRGEDVVIRFDLPGADPDSIDLTVERNVLTVRAERTADRVENDEVLAAERRTGTASRQVFLGDTLDSSAIEASYDRGVLELRIPTASEAKPRKVEVTSGEGREAIDSRAAESG